MGCRGSIVEDGTETRQPEEVEEHMAHLSGCLGVGKNMNKSKSEHKGREIVFSQRKV